MEKLYQKEPRFFCQRRSPQLRLGLERRPVMESLDMLRSNATGDFALPNDNAALAS